MSKHTKMAIRTVSSLSKSPTKFNLMLSTFNRVLIRRTIRLRRHEKIYNKEMKRKKVKKSDGKYQ